MRNVFFALSLMAALLFVSCAGTGNTVIASGADLSKYEYVIIPTENTGDGTLRLETLNAINEIGKTRLVNIPIADVNQYDKSKILSVHIAVSQSGIESVIAADFTDYRTDLPVVSVKGRFGEGMSKDGDMSGAMSAFKKQLHKLFGSK